jgi:hypothetical protein
MSRISIMSDPNFSALLSNIAQVVVRVLRTVLKSLRPDSIVWHLCCRSFPTPEENEESVVPWAGALSTAEGFAVMAVEDNLEPLRPDRECYSVN